MLTEKCSSKKNKASSVTQHKISTELKLKIFFENYRKVQWIFSDNCASDWSNLVDTQTWIYLITDTSNIKNEKILR